MCFVIVNRWRSCQHDERTKQVAAFCAAAKAHARDRASFIGPRYCGRGMCSPQYMREYDCDSPNGGVCPGCTAEMEEAERRQRQDQAPGPESGTDASSSRAAVGRRTGPEIFLAYQQHRAEDAHVPSAMLSTACRRAFPDIHTEEPGRSVSRDGGALLYHPTTMPQHQRLQYSLFQPAPPSTPPQSQPQTPAPSRAPAWSFVFDSSATTSQENSATSSGSWSSIIVHRVFSNYPQSTRVAIERAVANQTPEKRAELLRGYANIISVWFE